MVLTLTVNTVGNPAQFLVSCVYFQNKWKNNIFIDFMRFHQPVIGFPSFPSFLSFHCSQLPTTRDRSIYLPCFILNSCRYCCILKATLKILRCHGNVFPLYRICEFYPLEQCQHWHLYSSRKEVR